MTEPESAAPVIADQSPLPFGTGLQQIQSVVALIALSAREAEAEITPLLHPGPSWPADVDLSRDG